MHVTGENTVKSKACVH